MEMPNNDNPTLLHDCVFYVMNQCTGEVCPSCRDYETYEDWDAADSLISEMRDML